jgi:hypothetical protein
VLQKVPVTIHCPAAILPSAQSVLATPQSDLPVSSIPACGPCDKKHPLLGLGRKIQRY